jgi:hypothetical protein
MMDGDNGSERVETVIIGVARRGSRSGITSSGEAGRS